VCPSLTGVVYNDPGEGGVSLDGEGSAIPQVGEAHAQPLVQRGLGEAAVPAGLDLLHGGPAWHLYHALHPTRPATHGLALEFPLG